MDWGVVVLVLTIMSARTIAVAADEAAAEAPEDAAAVALRAGSRLLDMDYETMVEALALTEEQQAQVKEKLIAAGEAQSAWMQANEAKLDELMAAASKAREAGDREAAGNAFRDRMALYRERTEATAPHMAAVLAVLTPEQKAKLSALVLAARIEERWKSLELTDEQKAAVLALCEAAVEAAPDLDVTDGRAIGSVMRKLYGEAREEVLTDEQRANEPRRRRRRPQPTETEAKDEEAEQ